MNAVIEKTFRAIVVDDHPLIRNGISNILTKIPGITCSDQAENGLIALEKNREEPYDIIFLDIGMPVMDGLTTMHHLNQEFPESNVIILTMYENTRQFIEFIELGVKGYLLKETDETEITRAITMIMEGSQYFTPTVFHAWTRYLMDKTADAPESKPYVLSLRELEVLALICQQLSGTEIGQMLCLSESTINSHRSSIMKKTGIHNTVGLVIYAIKEGIFKP
jgi:DNA-binding NarL/FixJ family response regulator